MKVAIIGSRGITRLDFKIIERHIPKNVKVIISGGAAGVDSLAENFAKERKLAFIKISPDYLKHGKRAPAVRNMEIVRRADCVLAIWDYKSRGTAHTIACCINAGVPVRVLSGG